MEFVNNNKDIMYFDEHISKDIANELRDNSKMLVYGCDYLQKSVDDLELLFSKSLSKVEINEVRKSPAYIFVPNISDSFSEYVLKFGQRSFYRFQVNSGFKKVIMVIFKGFGQKYIEEDTKYIEEELGFSIYYLVRPEISRKSMEEFKSFLSLRGENFFFLRLENFPSTVRKLKMLFGTNFKVHIASCNNNLGIQNSKERWALPFIFRKYSSVISSYSRQVRRPYIAKNAKFKLPLYNVNQQNFKVDPVGSATSIEEYAKNRKEIADSADIMARTLLNLSQIDYENLVKSSGLTFDKF